MGDADSSLPRTSSSKRSHKVTGTITDVSEIPVVVEAPPSPSNSSEADQNPPSSEAPSPRKLSKGKGKAPLEAPRSVLKKQVSKQTSSANPNQASSSSPNPTPSPSPNPAPSPSPSPDPSSSSNPAPSASSNSAPSTSPNPAPSASSNPVPSASSNPAPPVSSNPAPSTSPNPAPSASSNQSSSANQTSSPGPSPASSARSSQASSANQTSSANPNQASSATPNQTSSANPPVVASSSRRQAARVPRTQSGTVSQPAHNRPAPPTNLPMNNPPPDGAARPQTAARGYSQPLFTFVLLHMSRIALLCGYMGFPGTFDERPYDRNKLIIHKNATLFTVSAVLVLLATVILIGLCMYYNAHDVRVEKRIFGPVFYISLAGLLTTGINVQQVHKGIYCLEATCALWTATSHFIISVVGIVISITVNHRKSQGCARDLFTQIFGP
ncbi:hypothetical protein BS50DRAFT_21763 [Corynespora cassiicola Philippines]|uniref:Uncharacterized protein n=1 Tax=Corynespora cassiicola Philippines TaxID=1448308 RepID=A0A2T2PAW6_CORCC|nr:hypothetical protein BS50DRAFT_21763 [Corynespora cassiicola Philippines]